MKHLPVARRLALSLAFIVFYSIIFVALRQTHASGMVVLVAAALAFSQILQTVRREVSIFWLRRKRQ